MKSSNGAAWYIDALDARAGMAFAAYRSPSTDDDPIGPVETTAVFISAPDFAPVRLASRGLALSATRSSFQAGFYVSDAEMPFATLESVAEFVRRLYLRGGGEDGPDRGGGGVPPRLPLEPNGGNGPGGPIESPKQEADSERGDEDTAADASSDAKGALVRHEADDSAGAAWFRELRAQIFAMTVGAEDTGGALRAVPWVTPVVDGESAEKRAAQLYRSLQRAAKALISELLSRSPKTEERSGWLRCASGLASALLRVGLWEERNDLFVPLRDQKIWPDLESSRLGEDSLDLLEVLPVPTAISGRLGLADDASVLDLLSLFFGSPVDDPETLDLVLFASHLIVLPRGISVRPFGTQQLAAVLEWLGQQLPRQRYPKSVEGALREAKTSPG